MLKVEMYALVKRKTTPCTFCITKHYLLTFGSPQCFQKGNFSG